MEDAGSNSLLSIAEKLTQVLAFCMIIPSGLLEVPVWHPLEKRSWISLTTAHGMGKVIEAFASN